MPTSKKPAPNTNRPLLTEAAVPKAVDRPRTAPAWVKVVVLAHVFCITVWSCPKPDDSVMGGKAQPFGFGWIRYFAQKFLKGDPSLNPPAWDVQFVSEPIQAYLFTTGTWQYWDMFAPNPSNTDWWGDADIKYKDGTHSTYLYPRMYSLSIPEKYLKERYRKFYERAHDDNYQFLFPVFGMRVAILNYKDPKNPPVDVALRRHWKPVADPGTPEAKDYNSYTYFTYHVDQKALRDLASRAH